MIENHIFDLYGTLVDIRTDEAMPSLWRRMALFMSLQGAGYTPLELREAYYAAVEAEAVLRGAQLLHIQKAHLEPDILPAFSTLYVNKGIQINNQMLRDAALCFRTLSMRHIRLYPGAVEVLRTLKHRGQGVYLLSNAQAAVTVPELKKLGLYDLFDGMVLSSDVGVKKPDRAIFEYILSKYGLRPETCLMVGNDEEADMLGAAALGIDGRYIHSNQSPARKHILPNTCREISSLFDLL